MNDLGVSRMSLRAAAVMKKAEDPSPQDAVLTYVRITNICENPEQ
jgi:hypothetical protein